MCSFCTLLSYPRGTVFGSSRAWVYMNSLEFSVGENKEQVVLDVSPIELGNMKNGGASGL